jgi:hypothetical protein
LEGWRRLIVTYRERHMIQPGLLDQKADSAWETPFAECGLLSQTERALNKAERWLETMVFGEPLISY